ncbi:hypothetical protein KY284_036359 [Solanum tuberosum]|nr:hypothetical protein KY284_036359 [Solanum tuberosum]
MGIQWVFYLDVPQLLIILRPSAILVGQHLQPIHPSHDQLIRLWCSAVVSVGPNSGSGPLVFVISTGVGNSGAIYEREDYIFMDRNVTSIGINRVRDFQLNVFQGGGWGESCTYWPNAGDKWGWRAGKRLDDSFEAIAKHKRLASIGLFDIDFDSDMKERTTSSRTKLQSLLPDSFIRAITCMAVSLVYAEIFAVSFAAKLSIRTKMDTVTFDVKQQ